MNSVNVVSEYFQGTLFTLFTSYFVVLQTGCSLADDFQYLDCAHNINVSSDVILLLNINVMKKYEFQ